AGRRIARNLQHDLVAELQACPRLDRRPVEAFERDVFAERPRDERVALRLQLSDRLHREQTDGALRAAMLLAVPMRVTPEAEPRDPRHRSGALGHAMPVPGMSPVCMISPAERAKVSAPGAARRANTDSRLTYSMSMKSGSTKPQRLTKLTMSVSETVRASVR